MTMVYLILRHLERVPDVASAPFCPPKALPVAPGRFLLLLVRVNGVSLRAVAQHPLLTSVQRPSHA